MTDPLREELKWIAGLLGEARDAEVMAQRLDQAVSAQPVELVLGAVTARIDHTLGNRYRDGLAAALEAMESPRYFALLTALDELAASPPWTPLAEDPVKTVLPRLLRRDWSGFGSGSPSWAPPRISTAEMLPCTSHARRPSGCATPPRQPGRSSARTRSGWRAQPRRRRPCSAITRTAW